MATNINNLASEFRQMLNGYTSDITERTMVVVERVAEETKEELGRTSPSGNRKKNKYKKSWKVKKDKKGHAIVYNTEYRLTHLLEKGHLRRDGRSGSKSPLTRAIPHIRPAEQKAIQNLRDGIEQVVREI